MMKLQRQVRVIEGLRMRCSAIQPRILAPIDSRKDAKTPKSSVIKPQASVTETSSTAQESRYDASNEDEALHSLTEIWPRCAEFCGNTVAIQDPHRAPNVKLNYKFRTLGDSGNLIHSVRDLNTEIEDFAYGLKSVGLEEDNAVALFSDSSCRWIVADQAVMMNGALDAVRGASVPIVEMQHIVKSSDSVGIIMQDVDVLHTFLDKESKDLQENQNGDQNSVVPENLKNQIKFVVLLWGEASLEDRTLLEIPVFGYDEILVKGQNLRKQDLGIRFPEPSEDRLATIVYTSGTSGMPKGVPLTQRNILYQIRSFKQIIKLEPGVQVISLLPPWHIYERAVAYYFFSQGVQVVYSSIKTFKNDLVAYPSEAFIAVPLILEVLYKKVMTRLQQGSMLKKYIAFTLMQASLSFIEVQRTVNGMDLKYATKPCPVIEFAKALILSLILLPFHLLARLLVHKYLIFSTILDWNFTRKIREGIGIKRVVVSGGSSLGGHLDTFFEAIGLPLINGWGLTETSPVLCCRPVDKDLNIRGSVGPPLPGTEIKIVDPVSLEELKDGETGVILARGPGVMIGYHKDVDQTQKVISKDHWFNTGDRGWRCPEGTRMAGNVVLTGRLKDTIVLSSGENVEPQPIEDCLSMSSLISHVMIIGQDHRNLGALIVPDPEGFDGLLESLDPAKIERVILKEVWKLEHLQMGFMPFMHILAIRVLDRPFSVEDGTLTKTLKLRREAIMKLYSKEVEGLLSKLR